ncbi:response regulator receiver protein [Chloroherpeton thalassium ATCC 35110]|uniref:Response regulator receiver protein n=1 Tax=Chloroherpeton thalassium (strain ATCC 35110 / GB-78) TaxID=517418 RepID=B3QU64_CHLT3|nr:sugar transferase [Chloroherpeton thalassium]ACF12862.1 response regulator receiver protein [Chloroherpeton thalassium ATCC 35110]
MGTDKKIRHILCIDPDKDACNSLQAGFENNHQGRFLVTAFCSCHEVFKWLQAGNIPDAIISEYTLTDMNKLQFLHLLKSSGSLKKSLFLFTSTVELSKPERIALLKEGVDDFFVKPIEIDALAYRLSYLFQIKNFKQSEEKQVFKSYKIPILKRAFDIFSSAMALILLSPVLFIVGLIIKLESKGPVLYKSKRVGMGYQIFDLYKFRSMAAGADKNIEKLKHLNMYQNQEAVLQKVGVHDGFHQAVEDEAILAPIANAKDVFIADNVIYTQSEYANLQKSKQSGIFMKFKDDPRVTKFGRFIRNTSIDELPQLINVLIGDISIVGNRPLPLYEAEKLTTDAWTERFMAPAGITGLWQVTKRGKSDMSEAERIALDNHYAQNCSVWFDIQIILKTFPALLQSENV